MGVPFGQLVVVSEARVDQDFSGQDFDASNVGDPLEATKGPIRHVSDEPHTPRPVVEFIAVERRDRAGRDRRNLDAPQVARRCPSNRPTFGEGVEGARANAAVRPSVPERHGHRDDPDPVATNPMTMTAMPIPSSAPPDRETTPIRIPPATTATKPSSHAAHATVRRAATDRTGCPTQSTRSPGTSSALIWTRIRSGKSSPARAAGDDRLPSSLITHPRPGEGRARRGPRCSGPDTRAMCPSLRIGAVDRRHPRA